MHVFQFRSDAESVVVCVHIYSPIDGTHLISLVCVANDGFMMSCEEIWQIYGNLFVMKTGVLTNI